MPNVPTKRYDWITPAIEEISRQGNEALVIIIPVAASLLDEIPADRQYVVEAAAEAAKAAILELRRKTQS